MPSKDENKQTPPIVIDNEPDPKDEVGVVVDLNKEKKEDQPRQEQLSVEDIRKMHSRSEFLNRNLEKTLKQVQAMVSQIQTNQQANQQTVQSPSYQQQNVQPKDELDTIAEQDWKKAVSILGEQAARKVYEDMLIRDNTQKANAERIAILNQSKAVVDQKYPQLNDETSKEALLYAKVLQDNPDLLQNVRGPELAMYRMEQMISHESQTSSQTPTVDVEREVQRRLRAQASTVSTGRMPVDNRVVLTKADQEYCDRMSIPYEEYAKISKLGLTDLREGVSV